MYKFWAQKDETSHNLSRPHEPTKIQFDDYLGAHVVRVQCTTHQVRVGMETITARNEQKSFDCVMELLPLSRQGYGQSTHGSSAQCKCSPAEAHNTSGSNAA